MKLIDLHLHLDGAISPDSARKLAKLQSIDIPQDDNELLQLLRVNSDCRNLNDFLKKFEFPCSLIQTPEGLSAAVFNLCEELREQNVVYAEIRFAPSLCMQKGMNQEDAVLAAIEGMEKSSLKVRLILCCMRGDEKQTMEETVRIAAKYLGKGVCAIDLAGSESQYPLSLYEDIFQQAKQIGVPFTIHAGEDAGPESIWEAVRLGAKRIGHGVRAIEDPKLMEKLAEKGIFLEICPTSNVQTRVVSDINSLPVRTFIDKGIKVTINTDDPSIEGTDLKSEWKIVTDAMKLTRMERRRMLLNSVNAAFLNKWQKGQLIIKLFGL